MSGSIKGRLFFWSLLITSTVLIALGISLYLEIKSSILHSVEHTLHSKVQILKGLLHEEHGAIEFELAEVLYGEYSIPRSGHYYKVILDNEVLASSPSLVGEDFDLDSGELIFFDAELQQKASTSIGPANEQVMVLRHDFSIFDKPATVYAAQSLEEEVLMINKFRNILLGLIMLNVLVLAFAALWIAKRSLRPLEEFSAHIKGITHKNMSERIDPEFQVDEVRNVAESFNSMLDRLQAAFESEKHLVADASHELKTPLSVIKAQCEVLLQKDRTTEEYTKALNKINSIADDMKKLLTDMLLLTRIDSGIVSSTNFKSISLCDCIERAIKLTEFMGEKKHIKINKDISADIVVNGDPDSLTEMFMNIIENTIKYSEENSAVEISLMTNSREAAVEIKDHGKGIGEEELGRIFDRFYRADASRSSEGTGLGLSIAKAIAETHGGKITVKSKVGKGSSFILTLPIV
ncbi:MAG: HAMP domain-containing protein [Thermodesulfovibrionia bacterium]|nr:HAMP domain-containing protein [Thermodesulfovibrionia bacterium]